MTAVEEALLHRAGDEQRHAFVSLKINEQHGEDANDKENSASENDTMKQIMNLYGRTIVAIDLVTSLRTILKKILKGC
uniref:Uncharacterized protein n=1 Tax=Caenorhabditis japonica TaxID=281687 RepID=A0A8R1DRN7_CAEJA